jgi:hypothetical protein
MKILHITFHYGCAKAIEDILSMDNIELTTKIVTSGIDGYYYNMTKKRSHEAYERHKDYYNSFDVIIVTDTVPLSRILLEGGYKGKLIIVATNRFDYADTREKGFPDDEYYESMRKVSNMNNVLFIANNYFEIFYALEKGVEITNVILFTSRPLIREDKKGYYIPTYHNDKLFELYKKCKEQGLDVTTGRYKDKYELAGFKAVIHIPYTWNSIALWDALSVGIPYYVPTVYLLNILCKRKGFWFQNVNYLKEKIDFCEFYHCGENYKFLRYFNSLENIPDIEVDYNKIYEHAEKLFNLNQNKWKNILNF